MTPSPATGGVKNSGVWHNRFSWEISDKMRLPNATSICHYTPSKKGCQAYNVYFFGKPYREDRRSVQEICIDTTECERASPQLTGRSTFQERCEVFQGQSASSNDHPYPPSNFFDNRYPTHEPSLPKSVIYRHRVFPDSESLALP